MIREGLKRRCGLPVTGLAALMAFAMPDDARANGALEQQFARFKSEIVREAAAKGIRASTARSALAGSKLKLKLPDLEIPGRPKRRVPSSRGQSEFTKPPQAYLNAKQLARLAKRGRNLAVKHRRTLRDVEARLGVPGHVVLGIWGRETAFGGYRLRHNAVDVLATLAFIGRRKEMFREELFAALRMIDSGAVRKADLRSSWAGAVGLTQFMPTEYFSTALDLDGDGTKNLWAPRDALASAANQLKLKGWLSDRPWGIEVSIGGSANCAMAGPTGTRTVREWRDLGLRRRDGRPFTPQQLEWQTYLLVAGGTYGPVFLVTENYVVFRRYNLSDLYALFVGDLANRIAGRGTFIEPWANLKQVTTGELAEIQEHLKGLGFGITKIDGKLGSNTRSQIGKYQVARGLKPDCWPTRKLLARVQREAKR
ncbi:MAG: peptidoglycan-binding protein [Pseudomonadota bacterium]